jgi:hypothetical protein
VGDWVQEITKRCWIVLTEANIKSSLFVKIRPDIFGLPLSPRLSSSAVLSSPPRTNVFFRSRHEDAKDSKKRDCGSGRVGFSK